MAVIKVYADIDMEGNKVTDTPEATSPGESVPYEQAIALSGSVPDFIQATPSDTWVMNHNTGSYKGVELFTLGGQKIIGDVQLVSVNQTIATFLTPIAGRAKFI